MKRFPRYGWLGLSILILAEILLIQGIDIIATWLTPIMWTGYILLMDAIVHRNRGYSRMSSNLREIPFLILVSVGIWLLFEVYNLHLQNWFYLGVPEQPLLRNLGFFWSFATILPGVFVTIDVFQLLLHGSRSQPLWIHHNEKKESTSALIVAVGLVMLIFPLLLPQHIAAFLFGFIWLGFIPLLEPINQRIGAKSLRLGLKAFDLRGLLVVFAAGLACGFIWETWNFQAFLFDGAYWVYTIPDALRVFELKFGMMPVLGLLGFPPFAWELILIYEFTRKSLGGDGRFGTRDEAVGLTH